jgi:hypothetical protein
VIQIRQIASEFAKAAELRVDGSFEEPSAEGFCVGKFGLVENLLDVMLAARNALRVQRVEKRDVRIMSRGPRRHNMCLQSCCNDH